MSHMMNLMGMRFGHWVAISPVKPDNPRRNIRWLCRCDCGNEKLVEIGALRSGRSTSCGCGRREWTETDMGREIIEAQMSAMRERRSGAHHADDILLSKTSHTSHHNYSGIRGITLTKHGTWNARTQFRGMDFNFGTYKTLDEAITALQEGRKRYILPHIKKHLRDLDATRAESRKNLTKKLDAIYKKYKAKRRVREDFDGE